MNSMRAVVYREYGGPEVLRIEDVPRPTPRDKEVLIRVRATTVTAADCLVRTGGPAWGRLILGLRRPRRSIIGTEFAGDVETVGRAVRRFKEGDRVSGFTGFRLGAYGEFVCMPAGGSLAMIPAGVSYEEAAVLVDGATTALYFLHERVELRGGQRILIHGASGSVGTYAIQAAKLACAEVTAVCSGANAGLVTSLGADRVIDYTREDFTASPGAYDLIFDAVGKSTFARCRRALTAKGVYVSPALTGALLLQGLWTTMSGGRRAVWGLSVDKRAALEHVHALVESGQLRPIIDRRYAIEEIVDAHRYVDTGRKRGNVVITVTSP